MKRRVKDWMEITKVGAVDHRHRSRPGSPLLRPATPRNQAPEFARFAASLSLEAFGDRPSSVSDSLYFASQDLEDFSFVLLSSSSYRGKKRSPLLNVAPSALLKFGLRPQTHVYIYFIL